MGRNAIRLLAQRNLIGGWDRTRLSECGRETGGLHYRASGT